MSSSYSPKKVLISSGIFASLFVGAALFFSPVFAQQNTASLHGYAWSSNIGWISLNCQQGGTTANNICNTSNYKVIVTGTGTSRPVTGYAWSSGIGWISFNTADTAQCGTAATFNTTNSQFNGFGRAIAGNSQQGWDGCISLRGTTFGVNYYANQTASIGTTVLPGKAVKDFAWGSTNVGWVGFTNASLDLLGTGTVDLKIDGQDNVVGYSTSGGTPTFTWTASNVTSCSATATPTNTSWTGTKSATGGTQSVAIPSVTSQTTRSFTITCQTTGGTVTDTATLAQTPSNAVINLTATPTSVVSGGSSTLIWTTQNVTACVGTSSGSYTGWSNTSKTTSGSGAVTGIAQNRTYTLTCQGNAGPVSDSATITVLTPMCSILGSTTLTGSGTLSNVTVPMQVQWTNTGNNFYPTNIGTNPPTGITAAASPVSLVGSSNSNIQSFNVVINGTAPTSPQTIGISGSPTGPYAQCSPGSIQLNPSGNGGGGGGGQWTEI